MKRSPGTWCSAARPGEALPNLGCCVADDTNLRLTISPRARTEKQHGRPLALVLNMSISPPARCQRGCAKTVGGARRAGRHVDRGAQGRHRRPVTPDRPDSPRGNRPTLSQNLWQPLTVAQLRATQREADRIIAATVSLPTRPDTWTARIDAVVLHPVAGLVILALILFVMFQAVFAWAQPLMELLSQAFGALGQFVHDTLPTGLLPSFCRTALYRALAASWCSCADHHHLPVHPAAGRFRLHGARGVPDGPHHGRRWPARPRLHTASCRALPAPSPASWRRG